MRSIRLFNTDTDTSLMTMTTTIDDVSDKALMVDKIVKFLLTAPVSNIADPAYGSALGDKGMMAALGGDSAGLKLLVLNAVDYANSFFQGALVSPSAVPAKRIVLSKVALADAYMSAEDPTVFYAEIYVYFSDGSQTTITV